jgi:hypothetical protein
VTIAETWIAEDDIVAPDVSVIETVDAGKVLREKGI